MLPVLVQERVMEQRRERPRASSDQRLRERSIPRLSKLTYAMRYAQGVDSHVDKEVDNQGAV
jgi:hypothetical protein